MKTQSNTRPLNSRQKHFLDRYHITGNLGQSWLDAGYNCSFESASGNAGRILQREDAQEYLAELHQSTRQHTGLTREKILDRLEEIIDDRTAKNRDVIWACREAGRMVGAYTPKPEPKATGRRTKQQAAIEKALEEAVKEVEKAHMDFSVAPKPKRRRAGRAGGPAPALVVAWRAPAKKDRPCKR